MTAHSAAAAPEAIVTVFSCDEQVAELLLVPNGARARKAVRGARTAGGERTWLRLRAPAGPMPRDARLRVLCCGRSVEFALQHPGAAPTGVVLRRPAGDVLDCDVGSLLHTGFVLQLRLRADSDGCYALDDAALTLPHGRPACTPPPVAQRTTASLEATLQAQHRRCDELASAHAALCSQLKAGGTASAEADKLRCDAGELGRLLRQARLAESELKQDVLARRQWDRYFSGEETRDVLENGVRRAHMEARLGREVTREDVEVSLQIPFAERARLIGLDPQRDDAPQLRRLPFARGPDI